MASRRQRRKAKTKNQASTRRRRLDGAKGRPTPVQAIEDIHTALAGRLAARADRYSQLLAKSIKDEHAGQHLVTRNGLSEEEHAEMRELSADAHGTFRRELEAETAALRELLANGEPFHSLALVQTTNLWVPWGEYYEPTMRGGENVVELVAGLLASQAPTPPDDPLPSDLMQKIFDGLRRILDLLLLVNMTAPRDADPDVASLRFLGVMWWMNVRGDSFGDHGRDLAHAIFTPFDSWMLATYGFTVADMIKVGDAALSVLETGLNELLAEAAEFSEGVFKALGNREALPPDVRARVATPEDRRTAAGLAFFDVFGAGTRLATTFTLDDLCSKLKETERDRAAAVLQELSIELGSVNASDYTGLFDASPLRQRPFLRQGDRYALPVPGRLIRDPFTLLDDRLMRGTSSYAKSRAKTLDNLAVGLIAGILPGSAQYTGLHYGEYELDGLVLFEDIAFVVEGKASALSVPARRGDVRRLVSEVRGSVEEAAKQGARARDFLLAEGESVFYDDSGNELVRIPEDVVREVQIVNPTLHEFGGHAPQLSRFKSSGLFSDGEFPWSVNINDLRVIAETAGNPAVFLHYLVWRGRLELGTRVMASDELDLWGAYLLGERFPPLPEGGIHQAGNSTTDFDAYYEGLQGRGPKRRPPEKFLKEPARAFVKRLATERPPGWRRACGVVLDLSLPELAFACHLAKKAGQDATAGGTDVAFSFGRGVLVGIPRGIADRAAIESAPSLEHDASFVIFAKETGGRHGSLVWAQYGETISLELSDFEKAAFAGAPSAFV